MKIFLSAVEQSQARVAVEKLLNRGIKLKYNLISYYYVKPNNIDLVNKIRDNSEAILVDSGAHSFQFGKKVNWEEYTKSYANFIKQFDKPNVVGYFEMDIENIIGYDKVKELRKILESVSNKIIPVWHPDRGIHDYEEMCYNYRNKIIAIGGFKGTDIKDEQYLSFIKVAKKYNCKVHCLGMTRKEVLNKVPFDYTDSSSWVHNAIYGRVYGTSKRLPKAKGSDLVNQIMLNYIQGMKIQEHYYQKWRKESCD